MIVVAEIQRKILKAIFEEEVKANEIMLELKKIDERAAEEQRSVVPFISFEPIGRPNALPKGFKSKTGKREAITLFQFDAVCHEQIAELEFQLNSVTETISKLEYEAVQKSKDQFKVPEKKKREISKLTSRLNHLTNFQEIISGLLYQREKYATNLEKIEKGTTSGMIEKHGVNRKTFTENIDSLIEENLI